MSISGTLNEAGMKSMFAMLRSVLSPRRWRRFSSERYWKSRYEQGRNSGNGSYGQLADFKADVLNEFVRENAVASVIEFGSGDGNQLALASYPQYVGYDVSPIAIDACRERFRDVSSMEFYLVSEYDGRQADLAMSLDVVYHLTEDAIFEDYMYRLFGASSRFVVIYSSNQDAPIEPVSKHVRHRRFTAWIERHIAPEWTLLRRIPNAYPYDGDDTSTSFSDFYIYSRAS